MAKTPAWQRKEGKSEMRGRDRIEKCKSSIRTSFALQGR